MPITGGGEAPLRPARFTTVVTTRPGDNGDLIWVAAKAGAISPLGTLLANPSGSERLEDAGATLAFQAKVAFLGRLARAATSDQTPVHETHMSWVFMIGDRAFKLKKPVRLPYLDLTTLQRREAACRAELRLNRRLAPDVYLDVAPLRLEAGGLSIGGEGRIVDWLVQMRRLDDAQSL